MRVSVAAFAVAMTCVSAAPAYGADVSFGGGIDAEGNATLAVNVVPAEGGQPSVSRCIGGSAACDALPVTPTAGGPVTVAVGDVAPGTVFDATYTKEGAVLASGRTPAWLGRVTNAAPPALTGRAKAGASVNVAGGEWSGGWAAPWGSRSQLAIAACTDGSATDCFLLSYGQPVKLSARWAGWSLLAYEARWSATTYPAAIRAATPLHVGELARDRIHVLSMPLGPVDGAAAPAEQLRVNGAPYASIRARATRRADRLEIGRVSCAARCKVELTVSGGGRSALRRGMTVQGSKVLSIPARRGRLTAHVSVDGKSVASGTTRAG